MKLIYQLLTSMLSQVLLNCISESCQFLWSLMKLMIFVLLLLVSGYWLPCELSCSVLLLGCESDKECLEKLQLAMQRLPQPHFHALKFLLHHLNR